MAPSPAPAGEGRGEGTAKAARTLSGSAARNPTSTVCEVLSAYSISNSASEEAQSKHQ